MMLVLPTTVISVVDVAGCASRARLLQRAAVAAVSFVHGDGDNTAVVFVGHHIATEGRGSRVVWALLVTLVTVMPCSRRGQMVKRLRSVRLFPCRC